MAISLNWVLAGIICVVVLSVAGATLGITMAVSLDALTSVGSERALSLTTDVSDLSSAYLNVLAFDATSTRDVATMLGALPADLAARGTNWTALYGSSMFTSLSDSNFTLFRAKIVFDDGDWMHLLSKCAIRTSSTCSAWWETTGPSTWAIGGRSISRTTFTDDPNTIPEEAAFPINPNPWANAQEALIRTVTNKQRSCSWEGLKFYKNAGDVAGLWVLTAGCNLVNSSGVYLGRVQYEAFVDRDLDKFLHTVERSPNSVLFIVDSELRVIASTETSKYFTDIAMVATDPVPVGCSSNADTNIQGNYLRLGCLVKTTQYPFRPLQVQDPSFLNTSAKSLQTVTVDGKSYYAVSERITSNLPGFSFNVVLFSPESDVIGDVERGRNIAIGVTAGVFVIGAAAAMFVTARLLQALTAVSEKLYKMAKLDDDSGDQPSSDENANNAAGANNNNSVGGRARRQSSGGAYQMDREMSGMDGADAAGGPIHREVSGSVADGEVGDKAHGANSANAAKSSRASKQMQEQSVVSEFAALQNAYFAMNTAMRSFTKYVPKDVVRELMAKKELCTINMEPLRCTMLFCDISGFTSICERVEPSSISELIKLYFERMSGLVAYHDGIIDKFIGDCIMTIWGAPSPIDHQELRGTLCALALQREARSDPLATQFRNVDESLSIRVGVASGTVHAGNMGSEKRLSYTVIGDAVNLAARLLSFNRQWYTSTMIPEELVPYVRNFVVLRQLVFAGIVGKEIPCGVYELIGMVPFNGSELGSVLKNKLEEQQRILANGNATPGNNNNNNGNDDDDNHNEKKKKSSRKSNLHTVVTLLQYHQRFGFASQEEIKFAEKYSLAATQLKNKRFAESIESLNALEQDDDIPSGHLRDHKSIAKLKEIAEGALRTLSNNNGDLPAENKYFDKDSQSECFVFRTNEK